MKILVVEDNNYKFLDIESALRDCGETDITKSCCRNGALLELKIAEEENRMYDLVILDMQMPIYKESYEIPRRAGMLIFDEIQRCGYDTQVAFCSSEPVECEDSVMNIQYDSSVFLAPIMQELIEETKKAKVN